MATGLLLGIAVLGLVVFGVLAYRDRFELVAVVASWVAVGFGIAGLVQLSGCGDAVSTSTKKGVCDSSYKGACLDAESSDYDCAGGSGDGPDYTGAVTVVGDDHFGLDRDGDGDACE